MQFHRSGLLRVVVSSHAVAPCILPTTRSTPSTPPSLHSLAAGHAEVVAALLAAGCDAFARNGAGATPRQLAERHQQPTAARWAALLTLSWPAVQPALQGRCTACATLLVMPLDMALQPTWQSAINQGSRQWSYILCPSACIATRQAIATPGCSHHPPTMSCLFVALQSAGRC
jgi:hypothetical protein